jgi:hypothetical protein
MQTLSISNGLHFKALGFKTVADVTATDAGKYFKNYFIESCYWGGKTSEQTSTTAATAEAEP